MANIFELIIIIFVYFGVVKSSGDASILCFDGFCRSYSITEGCAAPQPHCAINNATHQGINLPSPTPCNCCEFCLLLYGEDEHCSLGGPGAGTTIGRCGSGLTCVADEDAGVGYCKRMDTECHRAQDDFDERYLAGAAGSLEQRPLCDDKGNFEVFDCIPTQTCFCQSETGERIFGEVRNLGSITHENMRCGCSRIAETLNKYIGEGVPYPVIGPRCTTDGNFHPIQCVNRTCYCVNKFTGIIVGTEKINLETHPITDLSCYDRDLDLYPEQSHGKAPYNFTTTCQEELRQMIEFTKQSEKEGYIMDFFNELPECLPDGSYNRVFKTTNGTKICINERKLKIGNYEAQPNTEQFDNMNCRCALTNEILGHSYENPVCCSNGNFREIQCRRGMCRCVDRDGRQVGAELTDVASLACYKEDWRKC